MLFANVALGTLLVAVSMGQPVAPEPAASSAAAIAAPAPAASASAGGEHQLEEIGHVRALTTFCKTTLEHANAAIDTTLGNDARIEFTIAHMKTIDLDSNMIQKVAGTKSLRETYVAMRAAAVRAQGEAKQVEADAEHAPTADQKAQLVEFAQALGGAAFRQKKMADQLGSYVAFLDTHPPINQFDRDQQLFNIQYAQTAMNSPYKGDARDYLTPTLSEMAKDAADRFVESSASIAADENHASSFVEPAFGPCK